MVTYVPTKLPDTFRWTEQREGAVLRYKESDILRVAPQKQGWVVEVLIQDQGLQRQRLLTRSRNVGMCWGSKWAKARVNRLEQMLEANEANGMKPATEALTPS